MKYNADQIKIILFVGGMIVSVIAQTIITIIILFNNKKQFSDVLNRLMAKNYVEYNDMEFIKETRRQMKTKENAHPDDELRRINNENNIGKII